MEERVPLKTLNTIPKSYYHVDVGLDYLLETLERYETQHNLTVPDFQRGHVWAVENQVAYIEWLIRGGTTGLDIYFNHPNWMGSFEGNMEIIDGLQRITAIKEFFADAFKVFGIYSASDFKRREFSNISVTFHVHNMKHRKDVIAWYLAFNSCGIAHSKTELNRVQQLLAKEI